jgi:hypothetical protein
VKKGKSPYLTPIINDPEIFKELDVANQLKMQFKKKPTAPLSKAEEAEAIDNLRCVVA